MNLMRVLLLVPYPEAVEVFPVAATFLTLEVVIQRLVTLGAFNWKYGSPNVITHMIPRYASH
jgi:hypothetical protein